jgi:hypothetical protein
MEKKERLWEAAPFCPATQLTARFLPFVLAGPAATAYVFCCVEHERFPDLFSFDLAEVRQ